MNDNSGRWPPVYDFEELGKQINDLISSGTLFSRFYELRIPENTFYQGDIVSLNSSPVYIDKDGDIGEIDENFTYWLILGNTCDLARENNICNEGQSPHLTQVTPLIPIESDLPMDILSNLKKYKLFKRMYIPGWQKSTCDYYLDFTLINSIEKNCLIKNAPVVARLHLKSWVLLHSCLVRYLARDDGRND
jgi:hypothetical protein